MNAGGMEEDKYIHNFKNLVIKTIKRTYMIFAKENKTKNVRYTDSNLEAPFDKILASD